MECPFVPERLAALKTWADSGAYRAILERQGGARVERLLEVVKIQAYELAPEGETVDPYVIVLDGDGQLLRTRSVSARRDAEWKGFRSTDKGVNQPRAFADGKPLFFEIWDANYVTDSFVGGFVIYPDSREAVPGPSGEHLAEYTARILWDWKEPRPVSRAGYARVSVRFTERPTSSLGSEAKGVK
jgi:hypothetical protein